MIDIILNWRPSAAGGLVSQPDGKMHKPEGGRQRGRCGHSKEKSSWNTTNWGAKRSSGGLFPRRSFSCPPGSRLCSTGHNPPILLPSISGLIRRSEASERAVGCILTLLPRTSVMAETRKSFITGKQVAHAFWNRRKTGQNHWPNRNVQREAGNSDQCRRTARS